MQPHNGMIFTSIFYFYPTNTLFEIFSHPAALAASAVISFMSTPPPRGTTVSIFSYLRLPTRLRIIGSLFFSSFSTTPKN
jgi:hypothetical protein